MCGRLGWPAKEARVRFPVIGGRSCSSIASGVKIRLGDQSPKNEVKIIITQDDNPVEEKWPYVPSLCK
jgi:hypothetical protein